MMPFEVKVTTRFDRELRQLSARHPDLPKLCAAILPILQNDPYNRTRSHAVKKLAGVGAGDGQYRIRSGRFRFRHDISDRVVYLKACALRREDTYRWRSPTPHPKPPESSPG
jgi:mRNA-degrading endonuclease RelE of RelBE toxin-antitoxin system